MTLPSRRTGDVARWDPLREFEDLTGRMGQLFESAFAPLSATLRTWTPPVDIEETDDAYVVEAELPGVQREDVNVELRNNELSVQGEVKERERVGVVRRQSRRTGRFDYRVTLPGDFDAEQVEASLQEGVLRVRVPKTPQAQPRRIEITTN